MKFLIALLMSAAFASADVVFITYDANSNSYTGTIGSSIPSNCVGTSNMFCTLTNDGSGGLQSLLTALSDTGVSAGIEVGTTDLANTNDTAAWNAEFIFPNDASNVAHHVQLVLLGSSLWENQTQVNAQTHGFVLDVAPVFPSGSVPEPSSLGMMMLAGVLGLAFKGRNKK